MEGTEDWSGYVSRAAVSVLALTIIVGGLCAIGANTAGLAALFSALLLALLAWRLATIPTKHLLRTLRADVVPLAAALLFIAWSAATALPLGGVLGGVFESHPLWRAFGFADNTVSISPYRTWEGLAAFLGPLAAYSIGALGVQTPGDKDRLGGPLALFTCVYGLFALGLYWATGAASDQRLTGNLASGNAAATAFMVLGSFAIAGVLRTVRRTRDVRIPKGLGALRVFVVAPAASSALALCIVCILLTASRAGMIAALASFVVVGFLSWAARRRGQRGAGVFAALALVAAGLIFFGGEFATRRYIDSNDAFAIRETMIAAHWNVFLQRPIVGHGLNTFHELNAHFATLENFEVLRPIGAAHNIFVQLLEETGVIGAAFFFLMLAPILLRGLTAIAGRGAEIEWIAAALGATCGVALHGMIDFGLNVPAIAALYAFLLGVGCRVPAKAMAQ